MSHVRLTQTCCGNPDTSPQHKFEHYSCILFYLDDILCIHYDPDYVLNKLNCYVPLKPASVGSPNMYLCTKLEQMQLYNGIWAWSMSPSKYAQEAVRFCKVYFTKHLSKGDRLPKRAENPFSMGLCPELDVFLVLEPEEASYYQSLIRVMKWMVEKMCTDMNNKVFLLSSYLAMSRQEHLEAALHVMSYLKLKHNS